METERGAAALLDTLGRLGFACAIAESDLRISSWNVAMAELTGVAAQEALASRMDELLRSLRAEPGLVAAFIEAREAASRASEGGTRGAENAFRSGRSLLRRPDGRAVRVSLSSIPIASAGSLRLLVVIEDHGREEAAERSRQRMERQLGVLASVRSGGIWEFDLATGAFHVSVAWGHRLGLGSREEAGYRFGLGEFLGRIHPDDRAGIESGLRALGEGRLTEFQAEYRIKDAQGAYILAFDRGYVFESDPGGRPVKLVGGLTDISHVRQLEDSLTEKSKLLRDVLDQAPQFVFARDGNGRFILANKSLADFYGREPEELIGADLSSVHPDRRECARLLDDDLHVIATGESLLVPETSMTSPRGKRLTVELSLYPFDVPGLPERAALGFAIDITETKRAQRALFLEKERLAVTLRSLGEGVIATDTDGRVSLMNPMAERITGWDEREALGVHIGQVFKIRYGQDSKPMADPVREIIAERRIVPGTVDSVLEKRSGELREITERGAPIIDEEGAVIGAVLIFVDVSERRAMEREIEKIQKVEQLGILAGGIAHDFNNILMAVLGNITLAKLNVAEGEETHGILSEAERAIHQAKRLTSQLSLVAKGGAEPAKERVGVKRLVGESCPIIFRGSNVECEVEIPEGLPDVLADPTQIAQVLQNLALNAREAMPQGGKVTISARDARLSRDDLLPLSPGDYVRVDVLDRGVGVSHEIAQRIFDPYYTTKSRGSGLGLTVSFSIVKKHGGCITLRSREGEGSTFSVYLPVYRGP
jgi:PAS domain S-box-containing protein